MAIVHTKLFRSNTSQAVRLSKSVEMPETVSEVDVVAEGNVRIITPAGQGWDYWFDHKGCTEDFMSERLQGEEQQRESLE